MDAQLNTPGRAALLFCTRGIVFVAVVVGLIHGHVMTGETGAQVPPPAEIQQDPAADPHLAEEQAAERQALGFLGYLDHGRYADSYAYTGMLIRAQLDRDSFAKQLEKARAGTGALLSRELIDAGYTTTVPGAPDGQYVVLHYSASFANRQETVETLTLAFAKGYWRVSGYYIK
jgi:Protein of unknown function (DUF4019)